MTAGTRKDTGPKAELRVWLLGDFRVRAGGYDVPEGEWRLRKAKSLIKRLALAPGRRLHREQLADQLWPELDASAALNNLNQAVYVARRTLEPELARAGRSAFLVLRGELLTLDAPAGVRLDVEAFEAAAGAARSTRDTEAYDAALALYRGDLLPDDPYENWIAARRVHLRRLYLTLLFERAELHGAAGERDAAIELLLRLVGEDQTREDAYRALMRLLAEAGRRKEALRQFERLRAGLRRELEEDPEPETVRLRDEIAASAPEEEEPTAAEGDEVRLREARSRPRDVAALPSPVTRFIGRETELREAKGLLETTRLLTLTGPGGVGKSRLAVELARDVRAAFAAVRHVDLGPLVDPVEARAAVGAALSDRPGDGPLLLVLDGCEHLRLAAAGETARVLREGSGTRIVATSRQALGLLGELVWTVPPLALGPAEHSAPATPSDAARLFADRARLNRPHFALDAENAPVIEEICRRLDGLPLAIELAAARLRVLSVEQIAARLQRRLPVLASGDPTVPERQRTLEAALHWSHDLLSEPERVLFRRVALLPGWWTLDDAERVCAAAPLTDADALDLVSGLVDKSLVVAETVGRTAAIGPARFRLLETIQDYAWERLMESGEVELVRTLIGR